jgi:hypothetical protein
MESTVPLLRRICSDVASVVLAFLPLASLASLQATSHTEQTWVLQTAVYHEPACRDICIKDEKMVPVLRSSRIIRRYMRAFIAVDSWSTWRMTCADWSWLSSCESLDWMSVSLETDDVLKWVKLCASSPVAPRKLRHLTLQWHGCVSGWGVISSCLFVCLDATRTPYFTSLGVCGPLVPIPTLEWIDMIPTQVERLHINTRIGGHQFDTPKAHWNDNLVEALSLRLPKLTSFRGGRCSFDAANRHLPLERLDIFPCQVTLNASNIHVMQRFESLIQLDHCILAAYTDTSFLRSLPQLEELALNFQIDKQAVHVVAYQAQLAGDLASCRRVRRAFLNYLPLDDVHMVQAFASMSALRDLRLTAPAATTLQFVPPHMTKLVLVEHNPLLVSNDEATRIGTLATQPGANLRGVYASPVQFPQLVHSVSNGLVQVLATRDQWPR